jgi:hypothetical protein
MASAAVDGSSREACFGAELHPGLKNAELRVGQDIHLTIMRNTKGGNTDIRCYIVRLDSTIFLKLQESIFLLHATRCSNMGRYVKRSARGLPNNLLPNFPEILWAI